MDPLKYAWMCTDTGPLDQLRTFHQVKCLISKKRYMIHVSMWMCDVDIPTVIYRYHRFGVTFTMRGQLFAQLLYHNASKPNI